MDLTFGDMNVLILVKWRATAGFKIFQVLLLFKKILKYFLRSMLNEVGLVMLMAYCHRLLLISSGVYLAHEKI